MSHLPSLPEQPTQDPGLRSSGCRPRNAVRAGPGLADGAADARLFHKPPVAGQPGPALLADGNAKRSAAAGPFDEFTVHRPPSYGSTRRSSSGPSFPFAVQCDVVDPEPTVPPGSPWPLLMRSGLPSPVFHLTPTQGFNFAAFSVAQFQRSLPLLRSPCPATSLTTPKFPKTLVPLSPPCAIRISVGSGGPYKTEVSGHCCYSERAQGQGILHTNPPLQERRRAGAGRRCNGSTLGVVGDP